MFGISASHLVIVAIILLLFGPKRLPELGQAIGRSMRKFKDSWEGIQEPDFRHINSSHRAKSEQTTPNQEKNQTQDTIKS